MKNLYQFLMAVLFPAIIVLIYCRIFFKKEDKKRFKEKIFEKNFIERKENNKLIWFHAASIGEIFSVLPLIKKINKHNSRINFLITTTTISSAKLIKIEFKNWKNITHQYFPIDALHLVKAFLNNWNPSTIIFVDSEIWPNFLMEIKKRKIPLVLINGRITKKTFSKWILLPKFAYDLFNTFNLCLASSKESKKNLEKITKKRVKYIGNLKFASNYNNLSLSKNNIKILNNYNTWCAASIHKGEEIFCLQTHIALKKIKKRILTIIIPRHINNVKYIKKQSKKLNLKTQVVNGNENIQNDLDVLIINSFGVLTKYFNYCQNIFIGKSILPRLKSVGGQNPIEAAKLGCKIYHGHYVYNFKEVYDYLKSKNISYEVKNISQLKYMLLKDFNARKKNNKKNINNINKYGKIILNKTFIELNKYI